MTSKKSKKIPYHYWDSCTFIHLIAGNEPNGGTVLKTLSKNNTDGKLILATSVYTLAEVVKAKQCKTQLSSADKSKIKNVFIRESIRIYELTRIIAERARDLMWLSSLKPADAIHIVTAELAEVIRFETYDDKLISKVQEIPDSFWKHRFDIGHPKLDQTEMDLRTATF